MLHSLHSISNEQQCKKLSAINPVENGGEEPVGSQGETMLYYHKSLPAKELEHTGGQRQIQVICIIHTVVGKKAYLGAVKKSIL